MKHENIAADRFEAQLMGSPFYQGAPCKRGHPGIRYVGNSACRDCTKDSDASRRALASADEREAERRRKREGKRSGKWKSVDPAAKKRHGATYRARVAARPETVLQKQQRELARIEARMLKIEDEWVKARMRPILEAHKKAEAKRRAPEFARRRLMHDRLKASMRRAVKRGHGAPGVPATGREIEALRASQHGRCAYCGSTDDLHLDHRIAVSKGGTHELINLQFLCGEHNMHKRTVADLTYRARHGIPLLTPWDGWLWRSIVFT